MKRHIQLQEVCKYKDFHCFRCQNKALLGQALTSVQHEPDLGKIRAENYQSGHQY